MNCSKDSLECFPYRAVISALMVIFIVLFGSTNSYAQSSEYVVFSVKGNVENISLGQVLKEGDLIVLPAEVQVSLLSKSGSFTLLEGPLTAKVTDEENNEEGEKALAKLSKLLFNEERFVSILGATRSLNNHSDIDLFLLEQPATNPWSPVLSKYNSYCLKLDDPKLFRALDKDGDLSIVIDSDTAGKNEITWTADSVSLDLKEFIDPSQSYITAFVSGRFEPITIHFLESLNTTIIEQAIWLAEHNCQIQALQLLAKRE